MNCERCLETARKAAARRYAAAAEEGREARERGQQERASKLAQQTRLDVLAKYGGRCACCALDDLRFLAIGQDTPDIYRRLNNLPRKKRTHIYCFNCARTRDAFGACPHQDRALYALVETGGKLSRTTPSGTRYPPGTCACGAPAEFPRTTCARCYAYEQFKQLRVQYQAVTKYGGSCHGCAMTDWPFLTIGDSRVRRTGVNWYYALNKQPTDPSLQLLCWNCNENKGHHGHI
jgi:hypothetical protein